MTKPREFWIKPDEHYSETQVFCYDPSPDITCETIHVIEKSAADKLADAIEMLHEDCFDSQQSRENAIDALKEYRGENV